MTQLPHLLLEMGHDQCWSVNWLLNIAAWSWHHPGGFVLLASQYQAGTGIGYL
jgi:hypothetical protein